MVVSDWALGLGCSLSLEPNPNIGQLGRNLMDLVGHRHFKRNHDASSPDYFTVLDRLVEPARLSRILVFGTEDEIVVFVRATEGPETEPNSELSS
jgi:hypothetical protein